MKISTPPALANRNLSLLDNIPMGIFVLGKDFVVDFWNRLMEEWTDISRDTIVGSKIYDFYPHFNLPKYSKRIETVLDGGPPTVFSSQLHKFLIPITQPNGEHRIQQTTITPLRSNSGSGQALFTIQDVTDLSYQVRQYRALRDQALVEVEERKRAEEELRSAKEEAETLADKLKRLSLIDGLTGIANRRNFDEHLYKEWRRAVRDQYPISLIMADIDFFKPFNDNFGHQAGDQCLRLVAEALGHITRRPGDIVARYGGEEFVLVLPNTSLKEASSIAEKCRIAVLDENIPAAPAGVADVVTISMGVASMLPEQLKSPENLIQAADYALYTAKHNGRNQWVESSDSLGDKKGRS